MKANSAYLVILLVSATLILAACDSTDLATEAGDAVSEEIAPANGTPIPGQYSDIDSALKSAYNRRFEG